MLSDPPVTVVLQGARAIVEHMAKLYLEHLAREEGRGDEGNREEGRSEFRPQMRPCASLRDPFFARSPTCRS